MKGIILAGGSGSRLWPMTLSVSKQLIPVYDKPMLYYPMSLFLEGGIKEILIICSPEGIPLYKELFGDGKRLGVSFTYLVQEKPRGIAEAFVLGEDFLDNQEACLILGDNLFHGGNIGSSIQKAKEEIKNSGGAHLFGTAVPDPGRFGVAEISEDGVISSIEEKPEVPKSNIAITGLYMYGSDVCERAKELKPSKRGELEITDLNMTYVMENNARLSLLNKRTVWLDTGTPLALSQASSYISAIQSNTGEFVACLEEIAWRKGLTEKSEMLASVEDYPSDNFYARYIRGL